MRFVCDSCRAQYMISDEKVGPNGVKVRCKKCGYVILVRKTEAAAAAPSAPEEDGSDKTQVMDNPMSSAPAEGDAAARSTELQSNPTAKLGGGRNSSTAVLKGVEDDEIGAVFDQVLSGSGQPGAAPPTGGAPALGGDDDEEDDRMRTRVLDPSMMQKLADQSAQGTEIRDEKANGHAHGNGKKNGNGNGNGHASHDWFVAIDDKQTGPLTVDKLKDLWNRGEIGPDSLCWRAGFADWLALSEVAELSSVLAPKPAKPVIVAPGAAPAVVTMPVESAFNSGGVSKSVRSEVPVAFAPPSPEESGAWKPSAASALASLVQEEIAALNKPAPQSAAVVDQGPVGRGLLDMPLPEAPAAAHAPVAAYQAPVMPDIAPTYGSRPPPAAAPSYGRGKGLVIGMVFGGVVVIALLAAILVLLMGRPSGEAPAGTVAKAATAAAEKPKDAVPMPPPPPGTTQRAPVAKVETGTAPSAAKLPEVTKPSDPPVAALGAPRERTENLPRKTSRSNTVQDDDEVGSFTAGKPKPPPPEVKGTDDEFESVFGSSKSSDLPKPKEAAPKRPVTTYIPPAPGAADIPETLGQADVMQVVLANKANIVKCVNEQKKKDPGISGKLVMRWTIQTSGRTSNVAAVSDEFKNTHLATCIGGLIKGWTFPRHKRQGEPINFPFMF